ncbi:PAS domain-containing sensor histidine kinase [Flavobacterium flavigenum]|uniref:PAS domain-containing sensor histidine kinase n=1 Tax=Flavobacterium flavigenum TaxID=3003258 RepID=UPI00248219B0|nr:ATP-binding protein [Flavobacterium flavigenum]
MYSNIRILKDIIDNTPLPIAVYSGSSLKIELANTAMIKTLGKGEDIVGKNYLDVLPEIQKEDFFDQAITVLSTGIAFYAENKKVDLLINGIMKSHYFNYSFIPLFDANGKVYGVMNTGVDVTDLHLAKQKIQSVEERLRIAVESSGIGTYEVNLLTKEIKTSDNFNTIMCSENTPNMDELLSKLHPDDLFAHEKAIKESKDTGLITYETRIINENCSKWIKVTGKIICDENDIPIKVIGSIIDIHEHKQFQEELKKQVEKNTVELRRSNDDLLHFANVVSHDLREPVRKIKIFNGLIRNDKEANFSDGIVRYQNKIDQSAERMQNIIEGILTYSTMDKNKQPFEKIYLNEVIENIKTDLELIINEKDAILIISELPVIEGAPILINQLFYNLIHNSLKFSKVEEPPKIIISGQVIKIDDTDSVEITIKDNGIGLDDAYTEKIFNAFERLHSKDQYEGNGLGLSLCRKIVKRHHGSITAKGEINKGSEFTVILPLRQEEVKNKKTGIS